ncbi:MAG: hypothetical protein WCR59_09030 [Planctomycetota bacterium]
MKIASVCTAFPSHWYEQRTLTEHLVQVFALAPPMADRLRSMHANSGIAGRYLTLPLDAYGRLGDFTSANAAWLQGALDLGERSCRAALLQAGVRAEEVDTIIFSTVTGLASPSVDARLVTRLGLRPDVKRTPMFGLALGPDWDPWPPVAFATARFGSRVAMPLQFGLERVWIGTPITSAPHPFPAEYTLRSWAMHSSETLVDPALLLTFLRQFPSRS